MKSARLLYHGYLWIITPVSTPVFFETLSKYLKIPRKDFSFFLITMKSVVTKSFVVLNNLCFRHRHTEMNKYLQKTYIEFGLYA